MPKLKPQKVSRKALNAATKRTGRQHLGYPVVERNGETEEKYIEETNRRRPESLNAKGLDSYDSKTKSRLVDLLPKIKAEVIKKFGTETEIKVVSSVAAGSAIFARSDNPKYWDLKEQHKTWDGIYPDRMKASDIDLNISTAGKDRGLSDFMKVGIYKIHIYPDKGEEGLIL